MTYLLVFLISTLRSESITTESFSDLRSCQIAARQIKEFVVENDSRIGDPVHYTCMPVSGK